MTAKSKVFEVIARLKKEFPREGEAQIKERFKAMVQDDESLRQALAQSIFDDVYDKAAQEDKSIASNVTTGPP